MPSITPMMSAILLRAGVDVVHGGDDLRRPPRRRGCATSAAELASWLAWRRRVGGLLHGAGELLHRAGGLLQVAGRSARCAGSGPGCRWRSRLLAVAMLSVAGAHLADQARAATAASRPAPPAGWPLRRCLRRRRGCSGRRRRCAAARAARAASGRHRARHRSRAERHHQHQRDASTHEGAAASCTRQASALTSAPIRRSSASNFGDRRRRLDAGVGLLGARQHRSATSAARGRRP